MKWIYFIFCQFIFCFYSKAQDYKRGNNWVTGFAPVVRFQFKPNFLIDTFVNSYFTFCSSVISDTNGQFQFYCTGYTIMNKLGDIMENGEMVNCPQGVKIAKYYGGSSQYDQHSIIIPKKDNIYYVFSTGMSDSVANNFLNGTHFELDILNYSVVDMDANNGKGMVTDKNKIILDKQHYTNCALTAVKHANGRDWWLVKSDCINHQYQTFLVQPDTILGPYYEQVVDTGDLCTFYGQIYFSDDGTKFATSMYADNQGTDSLPFYNWNRVELYDFDRCTGKFTFRNVFKVPMDTSSYPGYDARAGICFSPNGKLLYMSTNYSIFQINIESNDVFNGQKICGPDTNFGFPLYNLMATGPDGKLYIGNFNGIRKYMSYIDKPNIKGLGCTFKPNGIYQPYTNLKSPPNMANYGLGALKGSPCDTIGKLQVQEMVIYPNPARDAVKIYLPLPVNTTVNIALYNILGQQVQRWQANLDTKQEINLQLPYLAFGLYTLKATTAEWEFKARLLVE